MTEEFFEQRPESNVLLQVEEGMTVYDREGNEVGEVEMVYTGSAPDELEEVGHTPAQVSSGPPDVDAFTVDVAEVLGAGYEDLNETVRERLMREGFARIDAGLLSSDRYVMPKQIAAVTDDAVRLNVLGEDLIERE